MRQYSLESLGKFLIDTLGDRLVDGVQVDIESEQELGVVLNACVSWAD